MVSETNWDLFWRYERLHRRHEPVDFRRWKRASQRALRELFGGDDVRVLDATAGLGDHTVNLAELGFRTEACDASREAREATQEALVQAGLHGDVRIFDARWEELGRTHPSRYDLVFQDAIHWIEDEDAMHRALVGLRGALVPGGSLVFFFADARKPEPGAGLRILEWDRAHAKSSELVWAHPLSEGRHVTHVRVTTSGEDCLDEHLLYIACDPQSGSHLESTMMRRIYRWDWHAMTRALARAGFGHVTSHRVVNDKGHPFALNLAENPGTSGR